MFCVKIVRHLVPLSNNLRQFLPLTSGYQHDALKQSDTFGNLQTFKKGDEHFRRKPVSTSGNTLSKVNQNRKSRPHQAGKVNIKSIFDFETEDGPEQSLETRENGVSSRKMLNSASMTEFDANLADSENLVYLHEDWENLKKEALSENPGLEKSWETLCMQLMYHHGHAVLASSFMDFLNKDVTSSPKIATLALYVALQGKYGTEEREETVLETYEEILKISDVFDSITAKYLIAGLSMTTQWQKTLDILEMAKLTSTPGCSTYSPIIAAAIREQDTDLAFELLEELTQNGLEPQDIVLQEILCACKKADSHDLLERYFSHMCKYNWMLSPSLAQDVEQYFTRLSKEKWTCKWTSVNTVRGVCHQCKHGLNRIELSTSDFEALQREFMERALVGSNVYLQSNPQEVERFRDFVMESAPFDVVLDALNIAFKGQGGTAKQKSKQLREIVHYFARERHMKVLVIGRAHMKKWPAPDMGYISRQAKVFFTDDISSDDPFCLYATLYSGKDCLFVSGDFMRNHKYNMGPRFKEIFHQWQKSRQIVNFAVHPEGVSVMMPNQFDCGPVKDDKGWHIPYSDGSSDLRSGSQRVLCLRYKGQQKPSKRSKKEDRD